MHFNRKKQSSIKFKITPRIGEKKDKKKEKKVVENAPIVRSKRKKKKLKIVSRGLNVSKLKDRSKYKPLSEWSDLLKGHPAFILGNAPSISKQKLTLLDPYFTIGVNRIFYLYTPVVLIWQDIQVWKSDRKSIVKQKSVRICTKVSDPRKAFLNFKVKEGSFKFGKNPKVLHGMGNTSAIAAQIAVNLGCSSIILLGTDCKYGKGNKTDFYGHNKDHKSYTLQMCNNAMVWLKDNSPVPIYNCSTNKLWPKKDLSDVIKRLSPLKMNKKKFMEIFKK